MFQTLIKVLFPSVANKKVAPNYEYFSQATQQEKAQVEESITEVSSQQELTEQRFVELDDIQQAFYLYLFGEHEQVIQNDELCQFVLKRVGLAIEKPKQLVESLPIMPMSLTTILQELKNDEFNTQLLLDIIQKEPTIAAKVIELANTSYYKRGDDDITDLKAAFMAMGANGLIEGVLNGYLNQFKPSANIYFKQFGEKLWQHSLAVGNTSKTLLQKANLKEQAATGYFVGLILYLGHMIIVQLMLEAFSYVSPDARPDKSFFRQVLDKYATQLTLVIAKYWHLPKAVIEALAIQDKIKQVELAQKAVNNYPLAVYVNDANHLNMIASLYKRNKISQKQIQLLAPNVLATSASKTEINDLVIKTRSS